MDPMTNPAARPGSQDAPAGKPWWLSRTLWLNIVGLAATLAAGWGFEIDGEAQAQIVAGVLAVGNILLRLMTSEPIRATKPPKAVLLLILAPALLLAACAQPGDPPAARWAATCDALDSAVRTATPLTVRMSATQADAFALGVGLFRGECVEGDPMAADHATLRRAADALARAYPLEEALSDGR